MNAQGATEPMTPLRRAILELLGKYEDRFGVLPECGKLKYLTQEQFADALRAAIASGKPIVPEP